ncbi:MAG: hypothetical protein ACRDNS_03580, partial [Trebonia sp.]
VAPRQRGHRGEVEVTAALPAAARGPLPGGRLGREYRFEDIRPRVRRQLGGHDRQASAEDRF